jgi:transcriptional regulator of acetoin/glycerol metabolism
MSRAHERSIDNGAQTQRGVRELVLASWRRSLAAGVRPDAGGAAIVLSDDELQERQERSPLTGAIEAIFGCLRSLDGDVRHVVAVADAEANLLWVRGEWRAVELAHRMRFAEGASWSESAAGTNAVGTAVALDHAVQIFSAEHLVAAVHPWTCSAAPIHDPATGELIGVVDLTSDLRTAHPHTLSLATLAAQAAEAKLRFDAIERRTGLRERTASLVPHPRKPSQSSGKPSQSSGMTPHASASASPGAGMLSLQLLGHGASARLVNRNRNSNSNSNSNGNGNGTSNSNGASNGASNTNGDEHSENERALRSLELLAVLAMHPDGLTAEEIALALYGESGKTVTIRAQVHRVRARLGRQMVQTQPYRLVGQFEADWMHVRDLVVAGRPEAALRAYRGPLLPASDAPAIVEARMLLEESLRRSVLTTADPELLSLWLEHASGSDDLAAARALVAVLPAGDPRRAAATATVGAIGRRLTRLAS